MSFDNRDLHGVQARSKFVNARWLLHGVGINLVLGSDNLIKGSLGREEHLVLSLDDSKLLHGGLNVWWV